MSQKILSFSERSNLTSNPTAKDLFNLMEAKETNLCLAADVTYKKELLHLADTLGPDLCLLKTHIDIIQDFDSDLIYQLRLLSEKHKFLIFEDRKFADIGNTVLKQYASGIYHIADWAHIINAHTVVGPGIIEGLQSVGLPLGRGLLLLAQMSSKGSPAKEEYTKYSVELAKQYKDFVMGFIAMEKLIDDPVFIHMTPGVQLQEGSDSFGQQYNTPNNVIAIAGSDVIIVGRGIYSSDNINKSTRLYRKAGWKAYLKRLSL